MVMINRNRLGQTFALLMLSSSLAVSGRVQADPLQVIDSLPTDESLDALKAVAEQLPKRLVIALDGLAYDDVLKVQTTEKRCMQSFYPASRAVSTYPSLSDIAWADMLRVAPPAGYQRYYYSTRRNQIIGGSLADMGNPQEYEHRMHLVFDKLSQHAKAYVASFKMAKTEIRGITEKFFESRNTKNFYAYMLTTDTVGHTAGDMEGLICYLDENLQRMQAKYKAVTGRDLEIALMSDHGNNHANQGKLTNLKENLRDHGFEIGSHIVGPKDVAFTTGGILTSASVFMKPESLASVAEVAIQSTGVDLITYVDQNDASTVYVRKPNGDIARVIFDRASGRYGYAPVVGDPLSYLPVMEAMRAAGKLDEKGFATDVDWVTYSSGHYYPVAPVRVYRGHHEITRNPAPLIVSLADGWEITYGFVKAISRMHKRGGTHGALSAGGSNGVVITNYKPTQDVYTAQVSD
ncbi:MAG: alkaline phosphatase family protein, partial [Bdellovibrionota bacterium]